MNMPTHVYIATTEDGSYCVMTDPRDIWYDERDRPYYTQENQSSELVIRILHLLDEGYTIRRVPYGSEEHLKTFKNKKAKEEERMLSDHKAFGSWDVDALEFQEKMRKEWE